MSSKIIRSPENEIPFCRVLYPDDGEPYVELLNSRTRKTEVLKLSFFVSWLIHEATNRPNDHGDKKH